MVMMGSLISEEDGGVTTRKSYDGLRLLDPRGKFDETVRYMYSETCYNPTIQLLSLSYLQYFRAPAGQVLLYFLERHLA